MWGKAMASTSANQQDSGSIPAFAVPTNNWRRTTWKFHGAQSILSDKHPDPCRMDDALGSLPSLEVIFGYLSDSTTWIQLAILASATLIAWMLGRWLQARLSPIIRPGAIDERARVAMRTGLLALVPIILWLLLFATATALRRHAQPTDLLRLALLLVGALALIRMGVFVLRHSFSPGSRLKAWEGVFTVTIWSLVALHLLGWLPVVSQALDEYAISFGQLRLSLYTLVSFTLYVAVWLLVALWVSNALQWRVMRSEALDESLKLAISKLAKFVLLTVAVVGAMLAAGIDLTAFAVFGGALGVGLGLGLQRVVSNFVSGIILAFEGSIRPGDVISFGEQVGTVRTLHARHVVVRTRDGLDLLVPNENLLTGEITNWSYGDRNVRLRLPVSISYSDDPETAIALLEKTAASHSRVLSDPPPIGCLARFADSGIDLELRAWVNDPERGIGNVRSDLNRAIWQAFKSAGITIPFPQRVVHVTGPAVADRLSGDSEGSRPKSARGRKQARKESR